MTGYTWDLEKEAVNIQKHGIDFTTASKAFKDPNRKIIKDSLHSEVEERLFSSVKLTASSDRSFYLS